MSNSPQGPQFSDPEPHAGGRRGRVSHLSEDGALRQLAALRTALLQELRRLEADPDYLRGQAAHQCCTRRWNQMRITPLEARAIAQAFQRDAALQRQLSAVLQRLRRELRSLRDNDQRQAFDCPLLDGTRCLVHATAKPIGCLAWHPAPDESEGGEAHFTELGWQAFAERDHLNDGVYGPDWKARAIPLWLRRVFANHLARTADLDGLDSVSAPRDNVSAPQPTTAKHDRRPGRGRR